MAQKKVDSHQLNINHAPVVKNVKKVQHVKYNSLDEFKQLTIDEINKVAEKVRNKYLTPGYGQLLTYQEKYEEAADFVAAGYPSNLESYPFISIETEITGKTKEQVTDDIISAKATTTLMLVDIERIRLNAKMNIIKAESESEIKTSRSTAITALEVI